MRSLAGLRARLAGELFEVMPLPKEGGVVGGQGVEQLGQFAVPCGRPQQRDVVRDRAKTE
jgi:hypothetical protein